MTLEETKRPPEKMEKGPSRSYQASGLVLPRVTSNTRGEITWEANISLSLLLGMHSKGTPRSVDPQGGAIPENLFDYL